MKTVEQTPGRLDYLDGVRAFALLLGIVFHASLSFVPIFIGWAVMDISTSEVVSVFVLISHAFRMELFFLIAGFFSYMTFHRKGGRTFLTSRFVRIVIPFVIFWFVMRPLLISCWIMGAESMRGEANIVAALQAGFATLGQLPNDMLTGTHLWFLYYLALITGLFLVIRYLLSLYVPLRKKLWRMADVSLNWFACSRLNLIALALPTAAGLWFMSHWGMDTPDKSLVPQLPVLGIYSGFFIFGWLLHRQGLLIEAFAQLSWHKLILCVAATVSSVLLVGYEAKTGHAHYTLLKGAFVLSYTLMMWSLVSLTIGVFKRYLGRPNRVVRYVADAAYWLYLVHLPIVVWLQIAFAELSLHWGVKLVAISSITIVVSLLLYDVFVRGTFVGVMLNGARKPRALGFQRRRSQQKTVVG